MSSSSSSQSSSKTELIRSPINFDMFACDQELKEMIFRRIYYILSPEHFLSNGKTPPRGFLLFVALCLFLCYYIFIFELTKNTFFVQL